MKKNLMNVVLLLFVFLVCTMGVSAMDHQNTEISLSGLPVPPGDANTARPSGQVGNLVVLDWAGFRGAVTYTYDDAQPSHIAHYNELQATGVPMTFFVSTNVNWIPNSDAFWSQAVKDGHEIGNHTVSHPHSDLTGSCFGKPLANIDAEIDECTKYIIQHFRQSDVWTIAAPFGDGGYKEAAKNRFLLNRGVNDGIISPNDESDPFNMPCYMANQGDSAEKFNSLIDQARSKGHWQVFLFHTIMPTQDNWYAPVEITEITKSINHAKSFKDVWIDTFANVGAYWIGQKLLAASKPVVSGENQVWTWTLPAHFPKGKYIRVRVDGGKLKQGNKILEWDKHGYYEVSLDEGTLALTP